MSNPIPQPDEIPPDLPIPIPKLPPGFEPVPEHVGRQQAQQARLTVLAQVLHYPPGGSPSSQEVKWSEALVTDEQPWKRWFTVEGGGWRELERGWLEDQVCSLLVLTVEDKTGPAVEVACRCFALVDGRAVPAELIPFTIIRPGRGMILPLPADERLLVRCPAGKARCCLTLIPE